MANRMDPDKTALIGAVCSESTLFACILKFSSNVSYLQQTTSADDIFRCIFLALEGLILVHNGK